MHGQQWLCLVHLFNEDLRKQCTHVSRMYENTTKTWQGHTKALFITTRLFAQVCAEEKGTFTQGFELPAIHREGSYFWPAHPFLYVPWPPSFFYMQRSESKLFCYEWVRTVVLHHQRLFREQSLSYQGLTTTSLVLISELVSKQPWGTMFTISFMGFFLTLFHKHLCK